MHFALDSLDPLTCSRLFFCAAFTADTPMDWSVEPNEGSLQQREATHFIVKFKPQGPGLIQGHLVIETEDFKKTWLVQGST